MTDPERIGNLHEIPGRCGKALRNRIGIYNILQNAATSMPECLP